MISSQVLRSRFLPPSSRESETLSSFRVLVSFNYQMTHNPERVSIFYCVSLKLRHFKFECYVKSSGFQSLSWLNWPVRLAGSQFLLECEVDHRDEV